MAKAKLSLTEYQSGTPQGSGDVALTLEGEIQVGQVGEDIRKRPLDQRPDLIVSSPYLRAVQSALPAAKSASLKVCIDGCLQEAQQDDGLHPDLSQQKTLNVLKELYPTDLDLTYESACYFATQPDGGSDKTFLPTPEKGTDVHQQRALTAAGPFIRNIEKRYPDAKRILMVGHASPMIYMMRAFTGDGTLYGPDSSHAISTATLATLERKDPAKVLGGFKMASMARDDYLSHHMKEIGGWRSPNSEALVAAALEGSRTA